MTTLVANVTVVVVVTNVAIYFVAALVAFITKVTNVPVSVSDTYS